jgi:hypothetical protein
VGGAGAGEEAGCFAADAGVAAAGYEDGFAFLREGRKAWVASRLGGVVVGAVSRGWKVGETK